MHISNVTKALDILLYYNVRILGNLHKFDRNTDGPIHFSYKLKERAQNIKANVKELTVSLDEIISELKKEKKVETLLEEVDERVAKSLRRDIKSLIGLSESMFEKIKDVTPNNYSSVSTAKNELQRSSKRIETILKKDIYQERLLKEVLDHIRKSWERVCKEKTFWIYHATSSLFLPFIKRRGLTLEELPKRIKDGIESMSSIMAKYGVTTAGPLDIDVDISKKGVAFAWDKRNIRNAAAAANLPAFMYELLNEEHMMGQENVQAAISRMTKDELKICQKIWKFGIFLRRNNNVVLLWVKVDPSFLKYLGLPDYLSNYDDFLEKYIKKQLNFQSMFQHLDQRKEIITYLCKDIQSPFKSLISGGGTEVRIKEKIPPRFIFIEVEKVTGRKLINISQWKKDLAQVTI
jgi:hypothetical protein